VAGTLSQAQTEASGPTLGKVSKSVTLTSLISGVPISNSSYAWDWICQTPAAYSIAVSFHRTQHIAASLQIQVTNSAKPSQNQLFLQMLSPSAADTASYFCS
ncbi:HVM62 protein, partial [Bucco capensis]|nr:HVM62 protein [Bucco capensis]